MHPAVRITLGLVGLIGLGVGLGAIATSAQAAGAPQSNRASLVLAGIGQLALGLGLVISAITAADLPGLAGVVAWAAIAFFRLPVVLLLKRATAASERNESRGVQH